MSVIITVIILYVCTAGEKNNGEAVAMKWLFPSTWERLWKRGGTVAREVLDKDLKMAIAHLLNEARVFWHFLTMLKELWPSIDTQQAAWKKQKKNRESRLDTFFGFLVSNVWGPLS